LDLGIEYKIFTCGNDDYEVLKLHDFQGPFTSNSKTFKALFCFQVLSRSQKKRIIFSRTFEEVWPPCIAFEFIEIHLSTRNTGGFKQIAIERNPLFIIGKL